MARICIVSLNSSGILMGDVNAHIGGVERQTALMANWLVNYGHDVSVVIWSSEGQTVEAAPNGIAVINICGSKQGVRGLRFFYPRWTSLIAALKKANADVYYHNAAEAMTGKIGLWCKMHRRRFVYSVASEPACESDLPTIATAFEKILYKIGLRTASAVVVQNSKQKKLLYANFGVRSVFLPMPCKSPAKELSDVDIVRDPNAVVWMGRVVPLKRLEILLKVADSLPNFDFQVVGGVNNESPYAMNLLAQASRIPNVHVVGAVPYEKTWDYYRKAAFLICTSEYEGFPNTFLEAMSLGIPIISTFDPGGILTQHELGIAVDTADEIRRALAHLSTDQRSYETMSRNAQAYFASRHEVEAAMPAFESLMTGASVPQCETQKELGHVDE